MDAFFVNVYLLDHPEDVGKPIAVGGKPGSRGVVSSASYEARAFGVRSAMPMGRALRLCPQLLVVSADWGQIRSSSQQVMALLAQLGPLEKMSVDEAYIDISDNEAPELVAIQIQQTIQQKLGLPCSVGLASCKLVAKVASDHDKPQGCTIVEPGGEAAFLAPLPTRALHGIGPRTAERLAAVNIHTCADLATADVDALYRRFGDQAYSLVRRAQGIDQRAVVTDRGQPKQISQERTFSIDVTDGDILRRRLVDMARTVTESMTARQLEAQTVVVKFRWADFTTFTRQRTALLPLTSAETIANLALTIFGDHWHGEAVRLLGVGVTNLHKVGGRTQPAQPPLPLLYEESGDG